MHNFQTILLTLLILSAVGCREKGAPADATAEINDPMNEGNRSDYVAARNILAEIVNIEIDLLQSATKILRKDGEVDMKSYKALYDEATSKLRVSYNKLRNLDGLTKADYDAILLELDNSRPRFEELSKTASSLKDARATDIEFGEAENNYRLFCVTEEISIVKKVFKGM